MGYHQIFKVPADGGDEVALTSGACTHGYEWDSPEWSSDGNWIVYSAYTGGFWRLYKVPSLGGEETVLTSNCFPSGSFYPKWSPDGGLIAYMRSVGSYHQIWTVTSDGSASETILTSDSYSHWYPQWSPDGNWIAYQKLDSTWFWQIYKVPPTGGAEIALTYDHYDHELPEWSPDGNWIVYVKPDISYTSWQIYRVPSGGGAETALTSDGLDHWYPQWSPDGNWIVYQKVDPSGTWQIYKTSSLIGIEETPSSALGTCILGIKPTISFSCGVVIDYSIKREGRVSLRIYDVTGKLVKELVNSELKPGNHTVSWNGSNQDGEIVGAGHYFVRLESGSFSRTEKVVVLLQ